MAYYEMLQKILQEKNLTGKEVREICSKNGVAISDGYFSRIKNSKLNPPSEEKSRAIAKACNVDERLLVLEGYIDKAPTEIQEVFKIINFMVKSATSRLLKLIKKGNMKELQEYLNTQPVSDTIIEILDSKEKYIDFLDNYYTFESLGNGFGLSMLLKEPIGFTIEDDAMFPIIQKGDKVCIDIETKTFIGSDIILLQYKKHLYARYIHRINSTYKLVPIVRTYKEIVCDENDIKILGRINNVIKRI